MSSIRIAGRPIGPAYPPYIVAEISANHNGELSRALALMDAIKAAGADAVKLQTYRADTLTIDHDSDDFRITGGLWDGYTLHRLYTEAAMPWEWHEPLFRRGRELGITVFSTPFDETSVDLLKALDAPAYKIASFEAADHALIACAAATGKPLIMSTGMLTRDETAESVEVARQHGARDIALLHCVSAYPAPPEDCNLRTIPDLASTFDIVVGLSDHTLGNSVATAAIAMGASLIEKHVTLARADGGPDAAFSIQPSELKELCNSCCTAWMALGVVSHDVPPAAKGSLKYRRSLYAVHDILAGDQLTAENVRSIRPGYGLHPKHLPNVLGRRASNFIPRGTPLSWSLVT